MSYINLKRLLGYIFTGESREFRAGKATENVRCLTLNDLSSGYNLRTYLQFDGLLGSVLNVARSKLVQTVASSYYFNVYVKLAFVITRLMISLQFMAFSGLRSQMYDNLSRRSLFRLFLDRVHYRSITLFPEELYLAL